MNKLTDTKNFIIKYLILELFEKLYRLRKYTETCGKFDRKNNNNKIIALFENSITVIGNEINKLCSEIETDLTDDDKFGYILKISQNSKAIVKIHEELKNLHSSWILPEIKTFTNEIIENSSKLKNEINIILSDHYSFLESNLGKKFEISLNKVYMRSEEGEGVSDNHSFILPKIEFSNPLNWTIIVHEAGHLQAEIINALRSNPEIMPDEIESINKKIIKNWAEEIYCDIYAISLLGPAYFLSFVSFALLSTTDYGISAHSDIHPSVIIRASIMINYLRDNNLIFESSWGGEDYSDLFYECLLEQHSIFKDEPSKTIRGLTKFNRNLRKLIKDLNLNTFSIGETDAKRIRKLIENLKVGIPIGSVSDNEGININEELRNDGLTKEKLLELKNMVSERGCKIWEILNAGWIYKLEYSSKEGMDIFFGLSNANKNIDLKINKYGEIVDFLDERLLSSINTSQIIKIIEGN
jgi:hypothetical protein